jgi:two-component system, sensor histidine kinase and response regulator
LEPIAHRGLNGNEQTHEELVTAQFLPRLVIEQQSPIAIQNARIDPRTAEHEFFLRHQWTSYLGLPLIAKQELLGVLSFYSREEREFSSEEMDFLNALVNEAAIAIYNSRLFEQTREQTIELEKYNKIKDEFLGVMSHELRTPLNIIMNYSEALKMGTFGEINLDQERGTEKIRTQASHLLSLINGILEITKIESGTATVVADRFDLTEFMSESKSDYMMPMEKDLMLEWDYPTDLPVIASDRVKLKQILMNLVNNAIKFTDQGSVKISARVLSDGQIFELQVADTGPGIPDDLLPFVFEKFRQIDSATTRNYSGVGLGLYIVKNFVDLLGGDIDVRSKIGEGSVFTVRLPIQREHAPTGTTRSQARATVAHTL